MKILLIILFTISVANADLKKSSVKLGTWSSQKNIYVFDTNDTSKNSVVKGVFGKKIEGTDRANTFQPLGAQAEWMHEYRNHFFSESEIRLGATQFSFDTNHANQKGWDSQLNIRMGLNHELNEDYLIQVRLGAGVRYWFLENGIFPSTGVHGVFLSTGYSTSVSSLLIEAGIFGIGMNSKKSAGVLRDSNSFRLKYERKYRWLDGQFVPGIEIFHTHREYFASKLVATKAAFMIDEISTGLTLSYIWDTK